MASRKRKSALDSLKGPRSYSIENDTAILPEVVAEQVVEELENAIGTVLPNRRSLMNSLTIRANRTFTASASFRKRISARGERGRDSLYAFMRHWLAGTMKRTEPAIYRKTTGYVHF